MMSNFFLINTKHCIRTARLFVGISSVHKLFKPSKDKLMECFGEISHWVVHKYQDKCINYIIYSLNEPAVSGKNVLLCYRQSFPRRFVSFCLAIRGLTTPRSLLNISGVEYFREKFPEPFLNTRIIHNKWLPPCGWLRAGSKICHSQTTNLTFFSIIIIFFYTILLL